MKDCYLCAAIAGALCTMAQAGPVTSVDLIAAVGQPAPGAPKGSVIATLNAPFTDGNGNVGFTGNLNPSNNFVWYDTGIVWLNSQGLPSVITGAEGTMGVSNTGNFIYSPAVDGQDAVWGDAGLILKSDDPAPGFPGQFSSFNSRPSMLPDGTAHWVGGYTASLGGATQQRVLYRRAPDGTISVVLATGASVGGLIIASPSGIEFDYEFSDNLAHHIHALDTTALTASDAIVYLDGAIALREGDATGQGDLWAAFDIVSVNNDGNYIVTGDTNGVTTTDEFIAYNGSIVVREGNLLDGVTLASGATLRSASINNEGKVVHTWGFGTEEHMFVGDGPTLGTSSVRILSLGDQVDTTGDGAPDYTVTDFEASTVIGPGASFSDDDFVYVEVSLSTEVGPEFEAIIRVDVPGDTVPCPADVAPDGGNGVVDVDDLILIINSWGDCDKGSECPADITANDVVDVDDLLAVINGWGDC